MESKTLATVVIVVLCILFFPLVIGAIAGFFGIVGGVIGSLFGILGAVLGAIFGAIGALISSFFGFFDWLFGNPFDRPFFHGNTFTIIALVVVILLIAQSRRSRGRR